MIIELTNRTETYKINEFDAEEWPFPYDREKFPDGFNEIKVHYFGSGKIESIIIHMDIKKYSMLMKKLVSKEISGELTEDEFLRKIPNEEIKDPFKIEKIHNFINASLKRCENQ